MIVKNAANEISTNEIVDILNRKHFASFNKRTVIKDLKAIVDEGFPLRVSRGKDDMIFVEWCE